MVERRKKHHYVSRGYLKRWSDDGKRVWVYRTLVSTPSVERWRHKSLREVGFQSHLYTRVLPAGESDELERWFDREFETPAERALERAVSGQRMERDDWLRLVRFAAAHDLRSLGRLEEDLSRWQHTVPGIVEQSMRDAVARLESGETPNPQEVLQDEKLPLRVSIEELPDGETAGLRAEVAVGRAFWHHQLRRLLMFTLPKVQLRGWTILNAPPGFEFFTSDKPMIRLNFFSPKKYDFDGGWDRPGSELIFPISPHHLLYRQAQMRRPLRGTVLSPEKAAWMQRLIAEHAYRTVFARSPSPSLEAFRPRIVDSVRFNAEQERWRRWHSDQSEFEREFL